MINVYEWISYTIKLLCILRTTYIKYAKIKSYKVGEEAAFFSDFSFYANNIARLLKAFYTTTLNPTFFVFIILFDCHSNLMKQIQCHWQLIKQVYLCNTCSGYTSVNWLILDSLYRDFAITCHLSCFWLYFYSWQTLWVLKKINPSSKIYSVLLSHRSRCL